MRKNQQVRPKVKNISFYIIAQDDERADRICMFTLHCITHLFSIVDNFMAMYSPNDSKNSKCAICANHKIKIQKYRSLFNSKSVQFNCSFFAILLRSQPQIIWVKFSKQ